MKKTLLFSGVAAAVALISAGCGPDLAQGQYGAEEQVWQEVISSSYSGYQPPRIAPPSIVDKASPEAIARQRNAAAVTELPAPADEKKPADNAAAAVDSAADKSGDKAAAPVDAKKEEVKADDKKADKKEVKADDKKAEPSKTADSSDCEIYVVKAGDTPGSIAKKFYGKASMYDIILKANPQIKDVKLIQIGTELKVPKL